MNGDQIRQRIAGGSPIHRGRSRVPLKLGACTLVANAAWRFLQARRQEVSKTHLLNLRRSLLGGPMIDNCLLAFIGHDATLDDLTKAKIVEYRAFLGECESPPYVVDSRMTAVKSFCRWLEDAGLVDSNPAASVSIPKPRPGPIEYLPPDQRRMLMRFFRANIDRRWGLFGCILIETGARAGEIRRARWGQFRDDILIIRATKTQKARTVPISEWLRGIVQPQMGPSNSWAFPGRRGKPVTVSCISQWLIDARGRGPEFRWSWKILRATYASTLVARGVPIEVVSRLLGHASVEITLRHYAHLRPEPWFSKVSAALAEDSTDWG